MQRPKLFSAEAHFVNLEVAISDVNDRGSDEPVLENIAFCGKADVSGGLLSILAEQPAVEVIDRAAKSKRIDIYK